MPDVTRIFARRLGILAGGIVLFGLFGCDQFFKKDKKNIQEFAEPWQTLEPGSPRAQFPKARIIEAGSGPSIEAGDLVQVNISTKFGTPPTWQDNGDWWIWIGFRTDKETSFFSVEPRTASALVGLREGSSLEFTDAHDDPSRDPQTAGTLYPNVFGDTASFSARKHVRDFVHIWVSTHATPSVVKIKRVCKGAARYRVTRLFDDSPVQVRVDSRAYTTREPRETWFSEAEIESKCPDGTTAHFQYGPSDARNGKEGRSPVIGYFDQWFREAWNKIPDGVQIK